MGRDPDQTGRRKRHSTLSVAPTDLEVCTVKEETDAHDFVATLWHGDACQGLDTLGSGECDARIEEIRACLAREYAQVDKAKHKQSDVCVEWQTVYRYEKHLADLLEWRANDAAETTQPEDDLGLTDDFTGGLAGSHSNSGTGSGLGTDDMADATDDVEQGSDTEAGPQGEVQHQTPTQGLGMAREFGNTILTRARRLASCFTLRGGAEDHEDDLTDGEMARLLAQEELHRSDEIHCKAQGAMQADTRSDACAVKSQTVTSQTGAAAEEETT